MNTKEKWIEETLNALDDIQSVEVPLSLKHSLLNSPKRKEIKLNTAQKWTIAASVIVLLGINLISMNQYSKKRRNLLLTKVKMPFTKNIFQ